MFDVKVNFVCLEGPLAQLAQETFSAYPWFNAVYCGELNKAPVTDVIVTPGNSWGIMDGTFDLAVAELYPEVPRKVAKEITDNHSGILMPGNSIIVDTGAWGCGHVVYAPTMIVPSAIVDPKIVYMATHSALATLRRLDDFQKGCCNTQDQWSVTVTGMGVATGMVDPRVCVKLMALAIDDVLNPPKDRTWLEATNHWNRIQSAIWRV